MRPPAKSSFTLGAPAAPPVNIGARVLSAVALNLSGRWLSFKRLTEYNAAGRELRSSRRLLLYGSCVRDEYPEVFESFARGRVPLAACPEAEHINVIALKLASMLARVDLEEVAVLTVDGSPHCVQLHHAVEEACRVTGRKPAVLHYVIEEGEPVPVSQEAVKAARYLSKIERLIEASRRRETEAGKA